MTPPPDPNPTAPVEEKCATCGREEVWHRGSMHGFRKPAPAPEPKQGSAMKPRCAWEPGTPGECSAYLALRSRLAEVEAENKELQKCSCEAPFENDCPACLLPSRMNLKSEREALRAEVERLRRLILQAGARENGLKADLQLATEELAAAKEEIAKLRVDLPYCTMPYHKELNKWYGDALKERDAARDDRDSNLKTHNTVMRELGQQLAAERAAREKAEKEWDYFDRRATEAKARVRELAKAAQAVVDVRPDLPNTLRGEIESLAAILANRKKEESNG